MFIRYFICELYIAGQFQYGRENAQAAVRLRPGAAFAVEAAKGRTTAPLQSVDGIAYTILMQCLYRAYTMLVLCLCYAYTKLIQCLYSAYTVFIQCLSSK